MLTPGPEVRLAASSAPALAASRFGRWRLVQLVDFHHGGRRSDSGDRLLGELADAIRDRPDQLAIDVNRAAAHARDHAGVFDLGAVQTRQNDVGLRAGHVAQHAENFDVHGLRLHAFEDGVGDAVHAGFHLVFRHDLDFLLGTRPPLRQPTRRQSRADEITLRNITAILTSNAERVKPSAAGNPAVPI